eukprot:5709986-Amphidinium_carterae.1
MNDLVTKQEPWHLGQKCVQSLIVVWAGGAYGARQQGFGVADLAIQVLSWEVVLLLVMHKLVQVLTASDVEPETKRVEANVSVLVTFLISQESLLFHNALETATASTRPA